MTEILLALLREIKDPETGRCERRQTIPIADAQEAKSFSERTRNIKAFANS